MLLELAHLRPDGNHRAKSPARNSNLLCLTDLHSLHLFKGQRVSRSIINPGGRRTRMSGDPLRDLDCVARIHVFGNACRTEAVTTNSFQKPAGRASGLLCSDKCRSKFLNNSYKVFRNPENRSSQSICNLMRGQLTLTPSERDTLFWTR